MRTFIAKNQKTGLKITFKYDLNGVLKVLEFDGDWTIDRIEKVKTIFPSGTEKMIYEIQNQKLDKPWIFAELTDISFEAFYKRYPKKVGRKAETEKAYNKLGDVDKMEAILFIEALIKLKSDGTAFPYPATYLNKKHWK
ncbi:hypothetical protein CLU96_1901 [Chryseobacterium sp. 52]|uniref:hypothetical protein n=1 Tax=Chryseobacterium sp. 52 TaxID=2035213 RepID=UPI000C19B111|nr:hypothetical protein [Chryseobacterium sp. 52]PIF44904.1 hypothetical protein CLU96_1901 [Chryseobacterium sp. 52]